MLQLASNVPPRNTSRADPVSEPALKVSEAKLLDRQNIRGGDCNGDPVDGGDVFPGADEKCKRRDDDCEGDIDDDDDVG